MMQAEEHQMEALDSSRHVESSLPIVQVCPCYVDFQRETGGVANVVRQLCLGLAERKVKTVLICGNRELGVRKAIPGCRHVSRFLEQYVVAQTASPWIGPVAEGIARLSSMNEIAAAHIHTCFSALTESAMLHFARRDVPYIFTPHGKLAPAMLSRKKCLKQIWWEFWAKKVIMHASTIAVGSVGETREFPRLGLAGRQFVVVPNGYPLAEAEKALRTQCPDLPDQYILFLGYLDPRKRPELLIDAFALSKARESHKLIVVGPDSYGYGHVLQDKIHAKGLEADVILWGPAYGTTKWHLLSRAACLVLPSLAEGQPVTLCESIGVGTPCIISEECNFPELVKKGAAKMVLSPDPDKWAEAIDELCLSNECLVRMKKAAFSASTLYSWENIVGKWMSIYRHLEKEGQGCPENRKT